MVHSPLAVAVAEDSNGTAVSVGGIYRRKHTLRAIFQSSFLVLLLGGYAVYHHFAGSSSGDLVSLSQRSTSDLVGAGASPSHLRNSEANSRQEGRKSVNFSRLLEDFEDEGNTKKAASFAPDEPCPVEKVADPKWLAAFYTIGIIYMFVALAIVCDEFFVPALEEISGERHLDLSMDVTGATFMAAGASTPGIFTNFVGTFKQSDIGIGTVVGTAGFNILFVVGMCCLLSKEVLTLTWWPLYRDSSYYAVGLVVLSLLVGEVSQGKIHWWGALVLLAMYLGYMMVMYYNQILYKKLAGEGATLKKKLTDDDATLSLEEGDDATLSSGEDETMEIAATRATSDVAATAVEVGTGGSRTPLLSDDALRSSSDHSPSVLAQQACIKNSATAAAHLPWPGTYHTGVLQLFLHPEAWKERGGVEIVVTIQGDLRRGFEQVDIDGDERINNEELGMLFEKLGHEVSPEDLEAIFQNLDLDGDGQISEEEFSHWYLESEEYILSKVKPFFYTFDVNNSGSIERNKIEKLLKTLEPRVAGDEITAMLKTEHIEGITYDEFVDWAVHSMAYFQRQSVVEAQVKEESPVTCDALSPPRGQGFCAWALYLLVLPLMAALTFTIPDVRRPGYGKWCYVSLVVSITWIGVFSFFMVDWAEILGSTIGIPSVVMGYTLLAAGTSVPDLLSSVIVARMGEGDMALSSAVGSNIFDILVALPLPWLVFTLWPTTPDFVQIQSKGIWSSILILIGILAARVAVIHCQGWKMTRKLGGIMFLLYIAFIVQAILTDSFQDPCFNQ